MPSRAVTSFLPMESLGVNAVELARVNALSGCYLISTEEVKTGSLIVNEVSMPSRAVTSFLPRSILRDPVHYGVVSMPSRAVTSFLQYPFKNLGFMRLPEPVFAGIYQNILTTAVFRAC